MKKTEYRENFGYLHTRYGKTHYKHILSGTKNTPIIFLHGGPGSTHFSAYSILELSKQRDLILYDQIGCGLSDRLKSKSKMTITTFVEELEALRKALSIKKFHLLGHSWGTMLGLDYYLKYPNRVDKIIFSSPCLSASLWHDDAKILIEKLPSRWKRLIYKHEAAKTTKHRDYLKAMDVYYKKHVFGNMKFDPTLLAGRGTAGSDVYNHMWGPSEFCPTGTLKNYERMDELKKVKVPALFTCGRFDEATPEATQIYASQVRGAQYHEFKKSAHVPYRTETAEYIRVMNHFLRS